jgi:MFS family permease
VIVPAIPSVAVSRVIDAVAPPRLGGRFRWLVASQWSSNLADGLAMAAGPLLVQSQTSRPEVVALATLLQFLPWLVFGLYAGVIADRVDRRRLMVIGNGFRAVVLAVLSTMIVADAVNVTVVLASLFVLGTAEVFVDTTSSTLLPMLIDHDDLGIGNSRLMFGQHGLNRLAGPALGGLLFAVGTAVPFAAQAAGLALAAVLVVRIGAAEVAVVHEGTRLRSDIAAGMLFVWRHRGLRILTITILAFNVTFGAAIAVLVLIARERLGLSEIGFGLLTTSSACGAVLGTMLYPRLETRLGAAGIMRAGLVVETLTHLVFASSTSLVLIFSTFFVFGIHEASWGTTMHTIRQRVTPNELQGRVSSVYMMAVFGSLVVGSALGGVMAGVWGITAPFWFGFVGSVLILLAMWRTFGDLTAETRGAAVVHGV